MYTFSGNCDTDELPMKLMDTYSYDCVSSDEDALQLPSSRSEAALCLLLAFRLNALLPGGLAIPLQGALWTFSCRVLFLRATPFEAEDTDVLQPASVWEYAAAIVPRVAYIAWSALICIRDRAKCTFPLLPFRTPTFLLH